MIGFEHSPETKIKMTKAQKGNQKALGHTVSEEAREAISNARKGMKFSEEHKRKLAQAKQGRTWKLIDGKRVWFEKEQL